MHARGWLLVVAGCLIQLLMLIGSFGALPTAARVLLAFAVLVMSPGYAFVAAGLRPAGRGVFDAGWALGFGVAWNALLVVISMLIHRPFTDCVGASAVTTPLLWLALIPWIRRAHRAAETPAGEHGWSRATLLVLAAALALGAVHSARYGAPMGYITDSPDHIGTLNRMIEHGEVFPSDAFFKDAGVAGEDPRKGLWHAEVAEIAVLSRTHAFETWRWLPVALVPLFALNAAAFGWLLRGRRGAAVAAWALVLTYGGSLAEQYLREAVFATKLGDQLSLAAMVAVLLDLERRSRASRLAAVLLGLAAVSAHLYYAIAFAMMFGALTLGLVIAGRGWDARARRVFGTGVALALASLPWLLWRASAHYAPVNVIHTAPQGLLTLAGAVRVMNIGVLWDWLGLWWVLIPLALPWLWREGQRQPAVLALCTTPVVVACALFVPPVVALLQPRLGYLMLRMVWMVPLSGFLAWLLVSLWDATRRGTRRARAALALAGVLLLSLPALGEAWSTIADADRLAAEERDRSPLRWAAGLAWMDAQLPRHQVVLSDPVTSYSIPMLTQHYVMTLLDQHSSPNDPHALDRIMDARNALDPNAPWDSTRAVVRRYGVDAIALNDRFVEPLHLVYWAPAHGWFAAACARLDRYPAVFPRVYDRDGFVIYRVDRAALDTLNAPVPPRPYAIAYDARRDGIARRMGERLPALQGVTLAARVAAPGDTVRGVLGWRALEPLPRGSYLVAVRFDTRMPGGFAPPRWMAKPARKLLEKSRHERYRFRDDHLPAGGEFGVDLWPPGTVIADTFAVVVPRDAAEGVYAVRVRMIEQPPYPNYRLSDYFFDDDYYAGLEVSSVIVTRTPRAVPERWLREAAGSGGH